MEQQQKLQESVPTLWRFIRHLWPYFHGKYLLLTGSIAAMLFEIAFRLLEPWPLKWVVDQLSGKTPADLRMLFLKLDNPVELLIAAAIAVVIISGLRSLMDYFNTLGFSLIGNRVLTDVRHDAYSHLQSLSLSFHNKAKTGDLVLRLTADVNMLKEIGVHAALPMLINFLVLFSMIGIMMWMNWKLALLAFSCLPLFWILTIRFSYRIRETSRKNRKRQGGMAATVAESIGAIKIVQALSLESAFTEAFSRQNAKSLDSDIKAAKLSAKLARTVEVLTACATAVVLFYGGRLALSNQLTLGELIVFLAYLKKAFKPMQEHARYSARLSKAAAAGERVLDLLDRDPEVRDLPGAIHAPEFAGDVSFENVSFAYEPGHPVLKSLNLKVPAGYRVAIVGPSGVGKSTLASLILRLYDPTEGSVRIDGRDLRDYTLKSLRSQISIVLQDSVLFATSVWENIAYGAPESSREQIVQSARLANADLFIRSLPQGYDTILGERGVTLSNGQRQRIAIARAAIRPAPILILDEPTIGLDEENERAVIEALERLSNHRTSFLITHDLHLASRCNFIVYLDSGCLLEQGSHEELMDLSGRYATLYTLQARTLDDVRGPDVYSN